MISAHDITRCKWSIDSSTSIHRNSKGPSSYSLFANKHNAWNCEHVEMIHHIAGHTLVTTDKTTIQCRKRINPFRRGGFHFEQVHVLLKEQLDLVGDLRCNDENPPLELQVIAKNPSQHHVHCIGMKTLRVWLLHIVRVTPGNINRSAKAITGVVRVVVCSEILIGSH